MQTPNVSQCANPKCNVEFKRLGKGRLFVHPSAKGSGTSRMIAAWLCEKCMSSHSMHFDGKHNSFVLVRKESAA